MGKNIPLALLLAFSFLLGSRPASALPVAVTNAGFEDNSAGTPFNEFTFGPPAGWSLYDPGNVTGGGAGATYFVGTLTPQVLDPIGNPGSDLEVDFDDVRLDATAVPEPSAAALALTAWAAGALRRKRRA